MNTLDVVRRRRPPYTNSQQGEWTMLRNIVRHGCLLITVAAFNGGAALAAETIRVRSRTFEIEYTVNEAALPLDSVELWYTKDGGQNWQRYGLDDDRQSPMPFRAPSEGLFGFFLVLTNGTGASSAPPGPSTQPHQWAVVDFTPPVVQLHPLRQAHALGQRVLQVRWTAIDSQLTSRPIQIEYQTLSDRAWQQVSPEPLSNTGRFDWRLPPNLIGSVALRIAATDRGGHRTTSDPQTIDVTSAPAAQPSANGPTPSLASPTYIDRDVALAGSRRAKKRVAELFEQGIRHRERGDYVGGIARLRDVVRLDPQMTPAFTAMASMLEKIGDLDRSLNAYEIALKQDPTNREALRGSAVVFRGMHDYNSAAKQLRTVLRYHPDDAEIWMNLGDIAVFQGDELLARGCYTRATQIDPTAKKVIADARERIALMSRVSRHALSTEPWSQSVFEKVAARTKPRP